MNEDSPYNRTDKAPNIKNDIAEESKLEHNQKLFEEVIFESMMGDR